jgi:hypothetical protein
MFELENQCSLVMLFTEEFSLYLPLLFILNHRNANFAVHFQTTRSISCLKNETKFRGKFNFFVVGISDEGIIYFSSQGNSTSWE